MELVYILLQSITTFLGKDSNENKKNIVNEIRSVVNNKVTKLDYTNLDLSDLNVLQRI